MSKIYWLLIAWMSMLSTTSAFLAFWMVAMRKIQTSPFFGICLFSILVMFFSIALARDAWDKDRQK